MRAFWRIAFKATLWIGGILLVIAGVFRLFFVDVVEVGHDGMAPTMIAGERVLMWRGVSDPEMGQILVCRHPVNQGQMVMGRVVGKAGMTLKEVRGQLEVSGTRPDRDIQGEVRFYDHTINREASYARVLEKLGNTSHWAFERERYTLRMRDTTVEPGRVFLMADNRAAAELDSRSFGTVPLDHCLGRLFMRFSPAETRSADLGHGWLDFLDP
ncbi:MAG: signal peptidase I [Myxococcales bacterium]|nr:signal peptidase I [Myxococcales bacterium]